MLPLRDGSLEDSARPPCGLAEAPGGCTWTPDLSGVYLEAGPGGSGGFLRAFALIRHVWTPDPVALADVLRLDLPACGSCGPMWPGRGMQNRQEWLTWKTSREEEEEEEDSHSLRDNSLARWMSRGRLAATVVSPAGGRPEGPSREGDGSVTCPMSPLFLAPE
jgi:hypothetical protein